MPPPGVLPADRPGLDGSASRWDGRCPNGAVLAQRAAEAGLQVADSAGQLLGRKGFHQKLLDARFGRLLLGDQLAEPGARDDGDIGADYEAMRGWIGHIHIKHRRLDVICGWPTVIQPYPDLVSGYRTFFLWNQPKGPFNGEVRLGGKKFRINAARTTLNTSYTDVEYFRPLFQNLKKDGYEGLIAVDNGWEGFEDRLPVAEFEAQITTAMADLARILDEIWSEESR